MARSHHGRLLAVAVARAEGGVCQMQRAQSWDECDDVCKQQIRSSAGVQYDVQMLQVRCDSQYEAAAEASFLCYQKVQRTKLHLTDHDMLFALDADRGGGGGGGGGGRGGGG